VSARRYLVVGNPAARSGHGRRTIELARRLLRERGLPERFVSTQPGGGTVEVVRAALDDEGPEAGADVVLALGGDGTFGEVARGVLAAREPCLLGLLPAGTANDQAASFGLPTIEGEDAGAVERNLDLIEAGHVTWLDVGRVELLDEAGAAQATRLFFDSVGWGLHPEILAQRERDRAAVEGVPLLGKLYRDEAVYAGAALKQLVGSFVDPTKFDAEVVVDGRRHRLAGLTDLICNATAIYAGSWVLSRTSLPDDGRFELVPIAGRRDWFLKTVSDLAAAPLDVQALGLATSPPLPGSAFEIALSRPRRLRVATQVDGEEWGAGRRFRVTVEANRLPLITRAGWTPPWA
jgi:diacylglycerol kinase family enzyme